MLRMILFPIGLTIAGCAILIALGSWQMDRLIWKEEILARIDARLTAAPVPLSRFATETGDEYSRVSLTGQPDGQELHVLVSGTAAGTGYRVISRFETSIGAILLDQGLLALDNKAAVPFTRDMRVVGTLLWPDDRTDSTPPPDMDANIWFARDVAQMSDVLDTLPLLVVATQTSPSDPRLTPLPVTTAAIPNNHLNYAVTWFSLAAVWAIMGLYLTFRTIRQKDATP